MHAHGKRHGKSPGHGKRHGKSHGNKHGYTRGSAASAAIEVQDGDISPEFLDELCDILQLQVEVADDDARRRSTGSGSGPPEDLLQDSLSKFPPTTTFGSTTPHRDICIALLRSATACGV